MIGPYVPYSPHIPLVRNFSQSNRTIIHRDIAFHGDIAFHTYRQTNSINAIVSQPRRGSTNNTVSFELDVSSNLDISHFVVQQQLTLSICDLSSLHLCYCVVAIYSMALGIPLCTCRP